MSRDKNAKFRELSAKRLDRAVTHIRLLGNLANRSNYDFEPDDGRHIAAVLDRELTALRVRFGVDQTTTHSSETSESGTG